MMQTEYETIRVAPIAGALGAEISGVDLAQPLDPAEIAEIRHAFHDYLVIFFRDQRLDPDTLLAFARHFGPIGRYPFLEDMEGHPGISEIIKEAHDENNFGGLWHSDTTYLPTPPLGSLLYARETPPFGGDTQFANMYLAYDALSDGMRRMLDPLRAVYTAALRSAAGTGGRTNATGQTGKGKNTDKMDLTAEHPVVQTHPETGQKALYVNCAHTSHFVGMTRDESAPILDFLFRHLSRPEFTCRFAWCDGSLALWDNRCSQHYALNDYHGHRRLMLRVTIEGTAPT